MIYSEKKIYISISRSVKSFYARDLIVLVISLLKGDKCVIHLVGNDFEKLLDKSKLAKIIYRTLLSKQRNSAILLSKRMKSEVSNLLDLEAKNAQLVILPGFLDLEIHSEDLHYLKRSSNQKHTTIGYMSNLIPEKGIFDFIDAIEMLLSKKSDNRYSVWVAGVKQSKVDYLKLEKLIEKGLIDYYEFVKGDQKIRLLEKTDIFILPTYYSVEVLPLALVEAAAYGAFVVSCATGDIEEVTKLANGQIVPKKNPKAICNSIEKFVKSSEFDPCVTSKVICSHFSNDLYTNKLISLFN